jgi:hypothetical protein
MARGGRRPGSGRKPLPRNDKGQIIRPPVFNSVVAGVFARGSSPLAPPTTNEPSPIEEFDAPDALTKDERDVWLKQAPHAFQNRTLTRATALAFERYCQVVVMERDESRSTARGGSNHRGILRQLNAYELQFMLVPCGKPLVQAPAPKADDDDAFFGGVSVGGRSA